MKIELEFKDYIIVLSDNSERPITITELNKWLRINSLANIKEFTEWKYSVNGVEKHFRIIASEGGKWNVNQPEKQSEIYFSFTCEHGIQFIKEFEDRLRGIIEKENIDPYTFHSPDSPVKIDM